MTEVMLILLVCWIEIKKAYMNMIAIWVANMTKAKIKEFLLVIGLVFLFAISFIIIV